MSSKKNYIRVEVSWFFLFVCFSRDADTGGNSGVIQ